VVIYVDWKRSRMVGSLSEKSQTWWKI